MRKEPRRKKKKNETRKHSLVKGKKVPGEEEKEKKRREKESPPSLVGPTFQREAVQVLYFIFIMLKNILIAGSPLPERYTRPRFSTY